MSFYIARGRGYDMSVYRLKENGESISPRHLKPVPLSGSSL